MVNCFDIIIVMIDEECVVLLYELVEVFVWC